MTDDIYVYLINIPGTIHEMVTPCYGGYTIYIDKKLDQEHQRKAYEHAMKHIKNGDFNRTEPVNMIEFYAHKED